MRRTATLILLAVLIVAPSRQAGAEQVVKVGPELQANTFTPGDQENARVATDPLGNFIVVYTSGGAPDGDGDAAGVQRFNSAGFPLGTEFFANTYTVDDQGTPAVGIDAVGNFVVVWKDESNGHDGDSDGIFGQRFSSDGSAVGTEFQVNEFTTGSQENPTIAVDPAGNFMVVWEGRHASDSHGIAGRLFDNTGAPVGGEFQVNTFTPDEQEKPVVANDAAGNFAVIWESHIYDGDLEGVVARRYDSTGSPLTGEFQVNTYTTGIQEHTGIAMDADGNLICVWDSYGQDGSAEGVYGQRFDSSGNRVGTEFKISTYTISEQEDPAVAFDAEGNFVVTWYSGESEEFGPQVDLPGQDGDGDGAFGQRFSRNGVRLGTEFQINTYTPGNQTDPRVATQPDGCFVVAWQSEVGQDGDEDGVFVQRFCEGAPQPVPVLGSASLAALAALLLLFGAAVVGRRRRARR